MKKAFFVLVLILCVTGGVLSALDSRGEYAAERYLWRLNKQMVRLSEDTQNTPTANYRRVADRYRNFIEKFHESDMVPLAYVYLARLYVIQGDYSKAREVLDEITVKYQNNENISVKAQYEKAQTYYKEGDVQNALATYNLIWEKYPFTSIGLKIPLKMAVIYADNNDSEWAERSFEKAVRYYKDLIIKYPNSPIEYEVLHLLVQCYSAKNLWADALDAMGQIMIKFSSPNLLTESKAEELIKGINAIAIGRLQNHVLAVNIYKEFIRTNVDHPLNPNLEKIIDSIIRYVKEKGRVSFEGNNEIR